MKTNQIHYKVVRTDTKVQPVSGIAKTPTFGEFLRYEENKEKTLSDYKRQFDKNEKQNSRQK